MVEQQGVLPIEPVVQPAAEVPVDSEIESRYGLVKTVAYVQRTGAHKVRSANARRQERYRDRLRSEGLKSTPIPVKAAEALKAAGSWDALVDTFRDIPVDDSDRRAMEIGRRVMRLSEVRRLQVLQWIGLKDVPGYLQEQKSN